MLSVLQHFIIRIKSEGYDEFAVSLDDLDVHIGEKGSSEIVRGIAARFKDLGVEISGFDMYTTSTEQIDAVIHFAAYSGFVNIT